MHIKLFRLFLIASIVATTGYISGYFVSNAFLEQQTINFSIDPPVSQPMLPDTLEGFEKVSNLIVVGTITSIKQENVFKGYDANGKFIDSKTQHPNDTGDASHPVLLFTDLNIKISRILKKDDNLSDGDIITLRIFGSYSEMEKRNIVGKLIPKIGQTDLYFLSRTPDGQAYGLYYGNNSRFSINTRDQMLMRSDLRDQVSYVGGKSYKLDEVATEIESLKKK